MCPSPIRGLPRSSFEKSRGSTAHLEVRTQWAEEGFFNRPLQVSTTAFEEACADTGPTTLQWRAFENALACQISQLELGSIPRFMIIADISTTVVRVSRGRIKYKVQPCSLSRISAHHQ